MKKFLSENYQQSLEKVRDAGKVLNTYKKYFKNYSNKKNSVEKAISLISIYDEIWRTLSKSDDDITRDEYNKTVRLFQNTREDVDEVVKSDLFKDTEWVRPQREIDRLLDQRLVRMGIRINEIIEYFEDE